MIEIRGGIRTRHRHAGCVAPSLLPDNLQSMHTREEGDLVVTTIEGTSLRSVIASVDDYLMNLAVADEMCALEGGQVRPGTNGRDMDQGTRESPGE
ncbi:MAG TPA: KEOPS complex subunit Pcc1 [Methanolinea sp.]|nr:KEOPS complex subunit Pcc1 [Methanolinea sp.]